METRTLLVDSSYLLKKSFDGAKDAYTSAGFMGGVYGFITTIRKLISEHTINKVVLVWDGENGGIDRHDIDRAYKANRKTKSWYDKIELSEEELRKEKEKQQSILLQKNRIQAYAEELFLRQVYADSTEADDLIAAYVMKHHSDEDIILYSNDQDFLQLLEYKIKIYLQSKKTLISAGNFYLHFPYHVKNALTLKIICGDTADNIKGIKGLGDKTLFEHFPELRERHVTVKELCQRAKEINEARIAKKQKPLMALQNLVEGTERLKINHRLVNLSQPFLNEEALEALEQLEMPLADEDRGSSNLYKLMHEDDFLSLYSNYGNFVNYVTPFSVVASKEKERYRKFKKTSG